MDEFGIEWTEYMRYRMALRGFDSAKIEQILRFSSERYYDTATGWYIAVGRHDVPLVMIAYEVDEALIRPITIHATTRQQIDYRLKTGRFNHE